MQDNYYEPHIVPDPSRPFIFHSYQASRGCIPHWHINIELLYFHSTGRVIRDREEYQVLPDDIVIFGSNTLHAVPVNENNSYDCLIVDGKFCTDNNIDISSLDFECVVRDPLAAARFRSVVDEIGRFDTERHDRFAAAGTKAAILSLMVYLCRNYSHPSHTAREHGDAVKRAIGYINSNLSKAMTISEIADYVKVSKYYFCREFRRETGYTLIRYINNLRCREAERMLRSGEETVSEVARRCGFDNLSYFTRTFRSVVGKAPSELRISGENQRESSNQTTSNIDTDCLC